MGDRFGCGKGAWHGINETGRCRPLVGWVLLQKAALSIGFLESKQSKRGAAQQSAFLRAPSHVSWLDKNGPAAAKNCPDWPCRVASKLPSSGLQQGTLQGGGQCALRAPGLPWSILSVVLRRVHSIEHRVSGSGKTSR